MALESFTRELDELIRKHLGTPKWGEVFSGDGYSLASGSGTV
jgi:hypothetical protein